MISQSEAAEAQSIAEIVEKIIQGTIIANTLVSIIIAGPL